MNDKTGGYRNPRRAAALAVVAAAAVVTTACGSSSDLFTTSSVQGGSATVAQELALAQCMRGHGVPNFPGPPARGQRTPVPPAGGGINPTSPQFRAAVSACQHLLPAGTRLSVRTHVSPGTHAP
jgi:hypothetical protein